MIAALLAGAGSFASAETVSVTIENTLQGENFFFTPVWIAAHNGGFDTFDTGMAAFNFPGLTDLAENGNASPLGEAFALSAAGTAGGVDTVIDSANGSSPPFSPGESVTASFDVGDASVNRFFSFASMVVPSNDLFFGNDNPSAHELFDAMGNFNGPVTIEIFGSDILDNGTEVNSATNDAAFSTNDGQSLPEIGVIDPFFSGPEDEAYLESFFGSTTNDGSTINAAFGPDDLVARITITPAPSGTLLLAGAGLLAARRRRG